MFDLRPWKKGGSREAARFKGELDNLFDRFFDLGFPSTSESKTIKIKAG